MGQTIETIEAIRTDALTRIQSLLGEATPFSGAENVPWIPWLDDLRRCVDWCDEKLAEYEPYELRSRTTS